MKVSRSVVLPAYSDNLIRALLGLRIEEVDIPPIDDDEVLVKMEAAPCNPSDIAFLRGGYNIVKPLPAVPGFEGAGKVVETGKNAIHLKDKHVSCFVQENTGGTWAEYFKANARDCIILKEELNREQAACLSINPLTAFGMFEMVLKADCKSIIQNAAGGQVPGFVNTLAAKSGIDVINLVRKPEHVIQLMEQGQKFVLNVEDENFADDFLEISQQLKPTIAFDAVVGDITGQMLNVMPEGSKVVVYGGLSGAKISGVDPMGIIFHRKSIEGFNLNEWIPQLSDGEFLKITDEIQDLFIQGDFITEIQGTFKLDDIVKGIRAYIKSMSAGKILLTP